MAIRSIDGNIAASYRRIRCRSSRPTEPGDGLVMFRRSRKEGSLMKTSLEALAGVVNARQVLPNLVTGGQPTEEQLAALKRAGGEVVLDVRDPMEQRPFDEPAKAAELGLEYVNVPISPGATGDQKMERILETLRRNSDRQVFFHCGSGNRVGGAMIAHLMLDHGMEEEEAVTEAMRMGLRSPEYMDWGLDYARRHANAT